MKHAVFSRTILANLALVAIATWLDGAAFYVDPLWFVYGIAALNIGLRTITREALTWRW